MKKEKVFFQNSRGQNLVGMLEGPEDAKAAVLLISGYASGKDEWGNWMVSYAAALNEAGFLSLRLDRSGIGESEGDFIESTLETELDDCIAAYNFLKTKNDVVLAAGHSMGGTLVVMLASKIKMPAIVSSAPSVFPAQTFKELFTEDQIELLEKEGKIKVPEDWENFGIEFFGVNYWKSRQKFDIVKYCSLIKSPILIIYGTEDKYVKDQVEHLHNLITSEKKLKVFEGADHSLKPYEKEFYNLVIDWFNEHLNNIQKGR